MKKVVSILIIGLVMLLILSFIPSNTMDQINSNSGEDNYLTLVPAKPAKPPTK